MQYENNFYLTHDRSLDIEFLFLDRGATIGWRAYILTDINYRLHGFSSGTIHRLVETDANIKEMVRNFMRETRTIRNVNKPLYYICWSSTIRNLEDMRTVAKAWSEITAYYIKHGGTFPAIQKKLKEKGII